MARNLELYNALKEVQEQFPGQTNICVSFWDKDNNPLHQIFYKNLPKGEDMAHIAKEIQEMDWFINCDINKTRIEETDKLMKYLLGE